jgi:hypothetical protein
MTTADIALALGAANLLIGVANKSPAHIVIVLGLAYSLWKERAV